MARFVWKDVGLRARITFEEPARVSRNPRAVPDGGSRSQTSSGFGSGGPEKAPRNVQPQHCCARAGV